ncbi:MAG: hypothetical protein J7501_04165 [Bdellovibrio sp.]|nr:hypothetical protein [Bdellovibrio sp.]
MKSLFAALLVSLAFLGSAHASEWTHVLTTTLMTTSPDYKDILIHERGTYSEIRLQVMGHARIDRFDTISHVLWGKQVFGLDGEYQPEDVRTATLDKATKIRWVRIYASSLPEGMPIPVRIWMR